MCPPHKTALLMFFSIIPVPRPFCNIFCGLDKGRKPDIIESRRDTATSGLAPVYVKVILRKPSLVGVAVFAFLYDDGNGEDTNV